MLSRIAVFILSLGLLAAALSACSGSTVTPAGGTDPSPVQSDAPSATPFPVASLTPTATPEPMALRVNGEGVSLAEFQAELQQLQAALTAQGRELSPEEQRQQVTDALVDSLLLAQGALEKGFALDDAALQAEIDRLAGQTALAQGQTDGEAALRDWQARHGYSEASFRSALWRSLAAAWQRDQIAESVPSTVEQIHARQILTLDEASARAALQEVQVPGVNFAAYAFRYDPQIGGDLGWFPRGYLTQPELEAVVFALQPGEISGVIPSQVGYHILQIIAREQRPLSPDARRALQRAALGAWLAQRRGASEIEIIE